MILNNISIFSTLSEIFISTGDEDLIRIYGKEKLLLERVIEAFKNLHDKDKVFENVKDLFNNDKTHYELIINYLVSNNILKEEDKIFKDEVVKNVIVLGRFHDEQKTSNALINVLNTTGLNYKINQFITLNNLPEKYISQLSTEIDLIILFSPFLLNMTEMKSLSREAYYKQIPIIHGSLEKSSFILGPILDPSLGTPSLECYLDRKLASAINPDKYLVVSRLLNKKDINDLDLLMNPMFNILIHFMSLELSNYFLKGKHSNIVSKEIEFDSITYETSVTKILKTGSFYNSDSLVSPFNS
jgi:hypothetical protein